MNLGCDPNSRICSAQASRAQHLLTAIEYLPTTGRRANRRKAGCGQNIAGRPRSKACGLRQAGASDEIAAESL